MFKDKHVIVALLVAPVLAVIAWFGVDQIVAEKPQAVEAGGSYTLLARSNCRYDSGRCDLENADVEVALLPEVSDTGFVEMTLSSSVELQGAAMALVEGSIQIAPTPMANMNASGTRWSTRFPMPENPESIIRVAVRAQGATLYAEVPTVFIVPN
ncbi:MAG: hypothetical protein AAGF72_06940 [Pseudomonadota bacterium]